VTGVQTCALPISLLNGLEESEYESGEQRTDLEQTIEQQEQLAEATESASIILIPSTSRYVAGFDSIKKFLEALYFKDDLIILGLMDMQGFEGREFEARLAKEQGLEQKSDTTIPADSWNIEVTFQKYQFSRTFGSYVEKNLVSLDTRPDEETLKYLRTRFGN
jgi:hypothetical protein